MMQQMSWETMDLDQFHELRVRERQQQNEVIDDFAAMNETEEDQFQRAHFIDLAAWEKCNNTVLQKPYPNDGRLYCNATFDDWLCWDYTPAGSSLYQACPHEFIPFFNPEELARKDCTTNGTWYVRPETGVPWTDYTSCDNMEEHYSVMVMYFSGYGISMATILVSVAIFALFRQLRCARVTLHLHLFTSYILNSLLWILYYSLVSLNNDVLRENSVWCRVLHALTQYTTLCNYCWMLCEGFYLHTLIVLAFTKESKLLYFCIAFAWGFPVLPAVVYSLVRGLKHEHDEACWMYDNSSLSWVVGGPVILSLVLNLVFLVNILRILLSKLRAVNSNENNQNWRALRAILILIPLLGLHYMLMPLRPQSSPYAMHVFQMISAFLTSYQGFFVSLIFCFFNGEVISVIKRKWGTVRQHYRPGASSDRRRTCSTMHTMAMMLEESSAANRNGLSRQGSRCSSNGPKGKSKKKVKDQAELQLMISHP